MKILVLLSVFACSSAQLVDPFFGFIPWVQPSNVVTLKTGNDITSTGDGATSTGDGVTSTGDGITKTAEDYVAAISVPAGQYLKTYNTALSPETRATVQYGHSYSYIPQPLTYQYSGLNNIIPQTGAHQFVYSGLPSFYHAPIVKTIENEEIDDDDDDDDSDENPLSFLYKPLTYHLPTTFASHVPLAYSYPATVVPSISVNPSTSPEVSVKPLSSEEPAATLARKKRSLLPLQYIQVVPDKQELEYETKSYDATNDPTPADTVKFELKTQKHTATIPTYRFVQNTAVATPFTYSSPAVVGYNSLPFQYTSYVPSHIPAQQSYHYNNYFPYSFPFYGNIATIPKAAELEKPAAETDPSNTVVLE